MIEPDENVLLSMLHIKNDDQANPFLEWLQKNLDLGRKSSDQFALTEKDWRQIQGGNACLLTILEKIATSHETLRNTQKNIERDKTLGKAL